MPTTRPWPYGHRVRSIRSRHLLACALTLVLVGCGQTDDGDSTSAERAATSPQTSSTDTSDARSSDEAMGIDAVAWPSTLQDAEALFDRMPDQLAGVPVKRWKAGGTATGIAYGPAQDGATAWVMSTTKATKTPERTLAVMFGPGVACEKGTYSGTVPEAPYGGGPALEVDGMAGEGVPWYACTIATGGAEGDSRRTAHAVGWVSGELGWLTTSPDERTADSLIQALIAAR
jgi:hypothetical protein